MKIPLLTALLLTASNVFMTFAWYAHLKELNQRPWYVAALLSWGIALFEYLIQVPANRIGYTTLTLPQHLPGVPHHEHRLTFLVFLYRISRERVVMHGAYFESLTIVLFALHLAIYFFEYIELVVGVVDSPSQEVDTLTGRIDREEGNAVHIVDILERLLVFVQITFFSRCAVFLHHPHVPTLGEEAVVIARCADNPKDIVFSLLVHLFNQIVEKCLSNFEILNPGKVDAVAGQECDGRLFSGDHFYECAAFIFPSLILDRMEVGKVCDGDLHWWS